MGTFFPHSAFVRNGLVFANSGSDSYSYENWTDGNGGFLGFFSLKGEAAGKGGMSSFQALATCDCRTSWNGKPCRCNDRRLMLADQAWRFLDVGCSLRNGDELRRS